MGGGEEEGHAGERERERERGEEVNVLAASPSSRVRCPWRQSVQEMRNGSSSIALP